MGGDLEKISEFMGEMKAHIVHIREKVDAMDNKVNHVQDQTIEQKIKIEAAHKRLDTLVPLVEDHERFKNKGLGIVAFIGFIAGGVGMFISKLMGIWH